MYHVVNEPTMSRYNENNVDMGAMLHVISILREIHYVGVLYVFSLTHVCMAKLNINIHLMNGLQEVISQTNRPDNSLASIFSPSQGPIRDSTCYKCNLWIVT